MILGELGRKIRDELLADGDGFIVVARRGEPEGEIALGGDGVRVAGPKDAVNIVVQIAKITYGPRGVPDLAALGGRVVGTEDRGLVDQQLFTGPRGIGGP